MGDTGQNHPNHVQVVVRVRPVLGHEKPGTTCVSFQPSGQSLQVKLVDKHKTEGKLWKRSAGAHVGSSKAFTYDAVMDSNTSQDELYDVCGLRDLACSALEGYPVTIFAFGQTGSGKSHTIIGSRFGTKQAKVDKISKEDGVLPRAVLDIFQGIQERAKEVDVQVTGSCCEIYNEMVTDLLAPRRKQDRPLPVCHDKKTGFYVKGLKRTVCTSAAATLNFMNRALNHRKSRAHLMNDQSSRSHCLFTLYFETKDRARAGQKPAHRRYGKLCIVDLAGSERLKTTCTTDAVSVKEAGAINKSLFALGQVLWALRKSKGNAKTGGGIPYRDSKLTQLLWDGLKGNGRALMIACCTPLATHGEETINTLTYASTAIRIKTEPVIVLDPHDRLVLDLKGTISKLQDENKKLASALFRISSGTPLSETLSEIPKELHPALINNAKGASDIQTPTARQPSAPGIMQGHQVLSASPTSARGAPYTPRCNSNPSSSHTAPPSPWCSFKSWNCEQPSSGKPDRVVFPEMASMELDFQREMSRVAKVPEAETPKRSTNQWDVDMNTPAIDAKAVPGGADHRALEWAERNPWFGSDMEMTAFAYSVHDQIVADSQTNCQSEEYYKVIEAQVQQRFPKRWARMLSISKEEHRPGSATIQEASSTPHSLARSSSLDCESGPSFSAGTSQAQQNKARKCQRSHPPKPTRIPVSSPKQQAWGSDPRVSGRRHRGVKQAWGPQSAHGIIARKISDSVLSEGCAAGGQRVTAGRKEKILEELRRAKELAQDERNMIMAKIERELRGVARKSTSQRWV
ncbi:hypothetical protein BSKO_02070 [Bryopsis sp. KO-2023]|nr:hypothetical protein BSKO_02070 [Bryopsis sp. KO-2023]